MVGVSSPWCDVLSVCLYCDEARQSDVEWGMAYALSAYLSCFDRLCLGCAFTNESLEQTGDFHRLFFSRFNEFFVRLSWEPVGRHTVEATAQSLFVEGG